MFIPTNPHPHFSIDRHMVVTIRDIYTQSAMLGVRDTWQMPNVLALSTMS